MNQLNSKIYESAAPSVACPLAISHNGTSSSGLEKLIGRFVLSDLLNGDSFGPVSCFDGASVPLATVGSVSGI